MGVNSQGGVSEHGHFWAVRIDGANGPGLALNGEGGRMLFMHRKAAGKFCRELKRHIESTCRVVQVEYEFREIVISEPTSAPVAVSG